MKTKAFCLMLSASLLAGAPAMAQSVIYKGGGYKDSAVVPVPVPAPIPDSTARWYLRADLAAGFMSADPSERGIVYGDNLYPPADLTGPLNFAAFVGTHSDTTLSFGGGFGYYWSPNFRTDLTIEGRAQQRLTIRGAYSYEQDVGGTDQVDGLTEDRAQLNSGLMMFNAYVDLTRNGAFTPYIGGGLGFSINQLRRNFSNVEFQCAPGGLPGDCVDPANIRGFSDADETAYTASFAAAAMAGFSYSITPVTMLDVNYRYLYIGGADASLTVGGARSTFSTGDLHEHQIRAGLRWNIQ